MIDLPPEPPLPPSAQIQYAPKVDAIREGLQGCGLSVDHVTVTYADELQGLLIVIDGKAGATPESFVCIEDAADHEFVSFEDTETQRAYFDWSSDRLRPRMIAQAKEDLAKDGLLEGFPRRADFTSDKQFAEAIELHCGAKAGSFFKEGQRGIVVQPDGPISDSMNDRDRFRCLLTSAKLAAFQDEVFAIGFVGNEISVDE